MLRYACLAFLVVGLSGCFGGGGKSGPTIDMTFVSGDGSATAPYTMPYTIPRKTNGGLEDYLAKGGNWSFNLDAPRVALVAGSTARLASIVYDTTSLQWNVEFTNGSGTSVVNATTALDASTGLYTNCPTGSAPCSGHEVYFSLFDNDPKKSQYGSFGYTRMVDRTGATPNVVFEYFLTGLFTWADSVPTTGGAVYNGDMEAAFVNTTTGQFARTIGGKIEVTADFALGELAFVTTTPGVFMAPDNPAPTTDTFSLTGTATVSASGVSFSDTNFTGERHTASGTLQSSFTGTLAGGFFGPAAEEIAGTFILPQDGTATNQMIGGFWASQ